MTEKPMGRRSSAGRFAWLWMVLTVLTMGAFLAWLGVNAKPEEVAAVVEEVNEAVVEFDDAELVALDDLIDNPTSYLGRALRLRQVEVTSRMGAYIFWAQGEGSMPFMVKFTPELVESGFAVEDGQVVDLVGQVREMSSAILDRWEAEGVLSSADDRLVAEFSTAYLDVVQAAVLDSNTPMD